MSTTNPEQETLPQPDPALPEPDEAPEGEQPDDEQGEDTPEQ